MTATDPRPDLAAKLAARPAPTAEALPTRHPGRRAAPIRDLMQPCPGRRGPRLPRSGRGQAEAGATVGASRKDVTGLPCPNRLKDMNPAHGKHDRT